MTLVEYGDFECPFCGQAEDVIRELLADFGDVRYVWRHLPLNDVHPRAQLASEAAEAASNQGRFWELHDLLLDRQEALKPNDLIALRRGARARRRAVHRRTCTPMPGAAHIAEDVDGADLSGVSGTPTFFVNGRRHYGAYDIEALSKAVRAARARALVPRRPGSELHARGDDECARSQASPAASTVSSSGAISWRSPMASAAQPRTLNGRRNAERESRTSSSSQSTGGNSCPSDGRDIEVDRRAKRAPPPHRLPGCVSFVGCDRLRLLELRAHVAAVLVAASRKRVAVRLSRPPT